MADTNFKLNTGAEIPAIGLGTSIPMLLAPPPMAQKIEELTTASCS